MPRKNKKTPANKKTEMSSPLKKTAGTKKSSKKVTDMDGSFLQLQQLETVSTVPLEIQHHDQSLADKSNAILALQKIDQSNQSLAKRVIELESNRSVNLTPLGHICLQTIYTVHVLVRVISIKKCISHLCVHNHSHHMRISTRT